MKDCPNVRLCPVQEQDGSMIRQVKLYKLMSIQIFQLCLQVLQWTDMRTMSASNVARRTLEGRHDVILRLEEETHSTLRSWCVVDAVMSVR